MTIKKIDLSSILRLSLQRVGQFVQAVDHLGCDAHASPPNSTKTGKTANSQF